ncbi:hypothetical protein BB559_000528 [Furculomyces boomerangus]|uniref:Ribosomal RNA-processing protein 7 C-terminal domain-containing protein n=2 Tax=Harpellales TaxID=61421 RepID=A0A2T9Z501_9FUNG|nr:hypothetical protein BB559_000528 [Furculomyces boomerangus]PVZ98617.1 hypothetical protein BB558_005380 [Smittium angustum]
MNSKKTSKPKNSQSNLMINDYKVVPIIVDQEDHSTIHYIYMKKHISKINEEHLPEARTLYIINLPVDTNLKALKSFFKGIGRVSNVYFSGLAGIDVFQIENQRLKSAKLREEIANSQKTDSNDSKKVSKANSKASKTENKEMDIDPVAFGNYLVSGSSAHVVFLEEAELNNVMDTDFKPKLWYGTRNSNEDPEEYKGLQKYLYEYRGLRPPVDMLKKELDDYMAKFEAKQYEKERLFKAQKNVPDEDGFITVTYSKNKADSNVMPVSANAKDSHIASKLAEKEKKTNFSNFYRWQQRENKKDQITTLRKKFEQDKKKIENLKSGRKFKPY